MKKLLICLFFSLLALALSANTVTVFGVKGTMDLKKYPLDVREFKIDSKTQMTDETVLRCCEALDNSKLVIFGLNFSGWQQIFGNQSIGNSFTEFLRRGGVAYFGFQSYDSLSKVSAAVIKYFHSVKITPWQRNNYLNFAQGDNGTICKMAEEYATFCAPEAKFLHIKRFKNDPRLWKSLVVTAKGTPVAVIQENICGKGTVIYSYDLKIFRETSHPMLEALLKKAFGENMKKQSLKERNRIKQQGKTAGSANDGTVMDLSQGGTIELINSKNGQKALFPTRVTVKRRGNILDITFESHAPYPSDAAKALTHRDGELWKDECVEVILENTIPGKGGNYHFIINRANTVYDSCNGNTLFNSKNIVTTVDNKEKSYTVNLKIDLAELDLADAPMIRANFARENHAKKEYSGWKKSASGFNNREAMGLLAKDAAALTALSKVAADGKFLMEQIPLFTRMEISTPPGAKAAEKLPEIVVTAGRNDKESVCIALYNQTPDTQVFRWEGADFIDGSNTPARDIFTVKEAVPWLDRMGRTVLEPLVKLNEANIITVPSGETRLLWIDVKSDLPAGKYTWKSSLVSTVNKDKSRPVVITLDLQNWRMPDDLGLMVSAYGPYKFSWAKNKIKAYWALCADYHINWIQLNERPALKNFKKNAAGVIETADNMDSTVSEELELLSIKEFKNKKLFWMYGYGSVSQFNKVMKTLGSDVRFGSEEGQKLFREWLTKYLAALQKAGISTENIIWNIMDEPRSKDIPDCVKFIKITNEFKLTSYSDFATWSTVDDVRQIADAGCSLLAPWEPRLLSRKTAEEELAICRKTGRKFLTYLCSNNGNTEAYLAYYRFRGMRGFLMKCCGISMWAMNSWRGNDWHSDDDKSLGGAFLVHHNKRGPIPTIRLEAYREAAEDMYLLRRATAAEDSVLQKLAAPETLNTLMQKNDPAALMLWKEKLNRAMNKTIVK